MILDIRRTPCQYAVNDEELVDTVHGFHFKIVTSKIQRYISIKKNNCAAFDKESTSLR